MKNERSSREEQLGYVLHELQMMYNAACKAKVEKIAIEILTFKNMNRALEQTKKAPRVLQESMVLSNKSMKIFKSRSQRASQISRINII